MSQLKVLVYGGKGWIGEMMVEILTNRGHQVILGQARLDNWKELENEVSSVGPDRIFSSTGRTHGTYQNKKYTTIDYLELPGGLEKNIRDNLRGPTNLAMIGWLHGIHVTYMGTGCIFQYDESHPMPNPEPTNGFTEEDQPNFFGSGYSTVKGQTDLLMRTTLHHHTLNCRIRMPITGNNNPRNFITKITTYEKICSIPNSMTVLPEILPIMAHMLETKTTGTYNMTNPGVVTHNQILDQYREKVNPEFTYQNFTPEEQAKILLSGRSNNYLDTTKLETYHSKHCPDLQFNSIDQAVTKVLEDWSN